MADTSTDFNGLPAAGALEGTDVLALQRGTGADSTKKTTLAALSEAAADALVAGSGITKAKASGVTTLESGGASAVTITGASATFALDHANRFIKASHSAAQTLTIPRQSSVAWPDNVQVEGAQWGAGAVTIVAGTGVTLRKSSKISATTDGQYAPFGLKRVASDEWLLFGQMVKA